MNITGRGLVVVGSDRIDLSTREIPTHAHDKKKEKEDFADILSKKIEENKKGEKEGKFDKKA